MVLVIPGGISSYLILASVLVYSVLLSTPEDAGSQDFGVDDLSAAKSKAPLYISLDNECIVLV